MITLVKEKFTSKNWHERFLVQAKWTHELRNYLLNKIPDSLQTKILEIGCGTGAVLSQIPHQNSKIYGLDINFHHLSFCHNLIPKSRLTCGDAHSLPYKEDVFDVVYCHFMLLWASQPKSVVAEFVRVGRSGGKIFLLAEPDYGGRIDHPPALVSLGMAQTVSLQKQGANPNMGRWLRDIAIQVGLKNIESGILSKHTSLSFDEENWESEWQMLEHDLNTTFSKAELQKLKEIDYSAWKEGNRILFIPTFYLAGEIP